MNWAKLAEDRIAEAVAQIDFTRRYNLERIDSVPLADWFTVPSGGVSHIAWQVGHCDG